VGEDNGGVTFKYTFLCAERHWGSVGDCGRPCNVTLALAVRHRGGQSRHHDNGKKKLRKWQNERGGMR